MILRKKFYKQDTLKVARELLGCLLVRKIGKKVTKGVITETEAYIGEDDLACHASKGRTPRTEIMYGEAGRAYVYMIYGMYHCLNIVTEKKGFPAAVLIRGVKIYGSRTSLGKSDFAVLNGPGKLCKFLKIDRRLNGVDITKREKFWIESGIRLNKKDIHASKRIGIDYAKHCKEYLWRFSLKSEK